MRLLLVTPGFSAGEQDWCVPALHHLVRRLARRHEVTVLALRYPPRRDPYRFFAARVLPLGFGTRTGAGRAALAVRAVAAIRREHRRRPLDAVHALWADEAGATAAFAGALLGVRSVVSVMGGELVGLPDLGYGTQLGRTGRWLVRRGLTAGDLVTVGSEALLAPVRAVRGDRPLRLAPLGVDCDLFHPDGEYARLEGSPCLLQVASLAPVKGQPLLLEAFARLRARLPGANLHLAGDGPLHAALADLARRLGVDDAVHLHGAVPHDRLPAFYRAADLHVQSSRFESQGMAVLEAAACGTATVGTAVGILPELERYGAGRTVTAHDPSAFVAVLLDLLEERGRARAVGAAALARVRAGLSLDQAVGRLEAAYSGTAPPAAGSPAPPSTRTTQTPPPGTV